ncbi:MAG TPA: hypothetical protein VFG53_03780 [Anaeromyxobacter sp.]|nr:hypothetical protein [Anaeromyxobacter sp.]
MRQKALALGVVLAALALSLVAGPHRRAALVGAALSGAAGLVSIEAMGRVASRGAPVLQRALLVMAIGFLLRIVLVALGTVLVVKSGESIWGFVTAFFVVYFLLAGVEGDYLRRQGQSAGPSA